MRVATATQGAPSPKSGAFAFDDLMIHEEALHALARTILQDGHRLHDDHGEYHAVAAPWSPPKLAR